MAHTQIRSRFPFKEGDWASKRKDDEVFLRSKLTRQYRAVNEISALIFDLCDGKKSVKLIENHLVQLFPDAAESVLADVVPAIESLVHEGVINLRDTRIDSDVPASTPPGKHKKLCVGMATYDDYDGVYFSLQAVRLYHPEVLDDVQFLVIDNNPQGVCAAPLKQLESSITEYRYVPNSDIQGTAVRDLVFREANSDYVLCMDSHVFFVPGSIRKLIDYLDDHPDCPDILQGPLLNDNLAALSTHFHPRWSHGMYGTWATDDRVESEESEPFDIPMQGLGSFACRRDQWPGFNPRFSGFGGEEGYIHEKFRQAGGRSLCLPFFQWMHRFNRPMGTRYTVNWQDRIRNYVIGHLELGWPLDELTEHFSELLGEENVSNGIGKVKEEMESGFFFFDGIYFLHNEIRTVEAEEMWAQFDVLGIRHRIRPIECRLQYISAQVEALHQLRRAVENASRQALNKILVVPDKLAFAENADRHLTDFTQLLQHADHSSEWRVVRLDEPFDSDEDWPDEATLLHSASELTSGCYAIHSRYFDHLLEAIPGQIDELQRRIDREPPEPITVAVMNTLRPAIGFS
ncbi:MAG: PqqD family peptide modification chaperone [Pseudomonadota bacterium]